MLLLSVDLGAGPKIMSKRCGSSFSSIPTLSVSDVSPLVGEEIIFKIPLGIPEVIIPFWFTIIEGMLENIHPLPILPLLPPKDPIVQADVLKTQAEVHDKIPPLKPRDKHEAPPKSEPSHSSSFSIMLSPQPGTVAVISTVTAETKNGEKTIIKKIAIKNK
jgi:hypothetical protein